MKNSIYGYLLFVLFYFLCCIHHKKAFLYHGTNVLWQNIPLNILSDSFRSLTLLDLVFGVGFLPLIFGSIGIYISIAREKKKAVYLFSAFALSILLLLVFRFLTISFGLMFFGFVLCIFSSVSIKSFFVYLDKLKFGYFKKLFVCLILVIFVFSSLIPSFLAAKESNNIANSKVKEIKWININTKPSSIILGNVGEGNIITTIASRKNVIDDSFLLAPDPIERNRDVEVVYTTVSEAIATNLIRKYNINLIYLSDDTKNAYNIDNLKYAKDSACFESIREGRYYVFKC
ncbi:hypothetical protein HYU23_00015 [Candidatus Woesearchaeota archaeon]|nr:hypothetical protein [Candidatus Woesearchaeota archaeon]